LDFDSNINNILIDQVSVSISLGVYCFVESSLSSPFGRTAHHNPSDLVFLSCERLTYVNVMQCRFSNEIDSFKWTRLRFLLALALCSAHQMTITLKTSQLAFSTTIYQCREIWSQVIIGELFPWQDFCFYQIFAILSRSWDILVESWMH